MAKIKICGLFREEDIDYANEAGPDYIGFVFAPSRRQVSFRQAASLSARLREGIIPVGVFVNAPVRDIAALYRDGVIGMAQLHGGEDAAYIAALRECCAIPVIWAMRMGPDVPAAGNVEAVPAGVDLLLLDNGEGGTGQSFDWSRIGVRHHFGQPWFLAGGIGLHNIGEALTLGPFGLDISGGAETGLVKDREKMIQLVEAVRRD
jgi:phosphoribosylanthranilate isomerase